jgi:hypothetical protein
MSCSILVRRGHASPASQRRRIANALAAVTGISSMAAPCDQASAVRAGEELNVARLQPFLQWHFGHNGPVSSEQFPSGHSNLTYLVRMESREVVLRRPPFGSKVRSAHDMAREYRVLSRLHTAYPLAPKALLYCDDLSILNAPFYLMEPIRGLIVRRDPPPGVAFPPETARRLSGAFLDNRSASSPSPAGAEQGWWSRGCPSDCLSWGGLYVTHMICSVYTTRVPISRSTRFG